MELFAVCVWLKNSWFTIRLLYDLLTILTGEDYLDAFPHTFCSRVFDFMINRNEFVVCRRMRWALRYVRHSLSIFQRMFDGICDVFAQIQWKIIQSPSLRHTNPIRIRICDEFSFTSRQSSLLHKRKELQIEHFWIVMETQNRFPCVRWSKFWF